jgi:hypothetical protein
VETALYLAIVVLSALSSLYRDEQTIRPVQGDLLVTDGECFHICPELISGAPISAALTKPINILYVGPRVDHNALWAETAP